MKLISEIELADTKMGGTVPAIPDSSIVAPLTFRVPCTVRKSVARGRRRETCWITAPSLLDLTATTRLTIKNIGSNPQNSGPGVRSNPGHAAASGRSNQGASSIGPKSYSPTAIATTEPAPIPRGIAHRRQILVPRNVRSRKVTNAAPEAAKPRDGDVPTGVSANLVMAIGMTVAAISMCAVPATTGVMIRRILGSQVATRNWSTDETTSSIANVAGPPSISATTDTPMNWPPDAIIRMCPAPNLPKRPAPNMVPSPVIIRAAKTAQER